MSYIRVYPTKNNTIFRRSAGTITQVAGNINTGKNPIMEIHDGNSRSKLVFGFNLDKIKDKLLANDYVCNFKIWDSGVIFEPILKDLKTIDLYYFTEDFIEGDGFAFLDGKAILGVSNWNKRTDLEDWGTIFNTPAVPNAFLLNSASDDIFIEGIESFIATALTDNKNPNFAISLHSNTPDNETYVKFVYGRRTRTIFQPYLEFFIDDEIRDGRRTTFATKETFLYLINQSGEEFTAIPTCRIEDEEGEVVDTLTSVYIGEGAYKIAYTPDISYSNKHLKDIWLIGAEEVWTGMFEVKSPNVIYKENLDDLYFYVSLPYTHPNVREGDIVLFNLIAETRRKGAFIPADFEYKVFCSNNFEMIPWTPVSVYRDKMFFQVNTCFFYPELEYEIFVRYKDNTTTRSSLLTTKFRVVTDGPTHLAGRAASPYNDRNYMEK